MLAAVSSLAPQRQQRQFEYAKDQASAKLQAAEDAKQLMHKEYLKDLKEQRATHAFEVNQLLGELRGQRAEAMEATTLVEGVITELET